MPELPHIKEVSERFFFGDIAKKEFYEVVSDELDKTA